MTAEDASVPDESRRQGSTDGDSSEAKTPPIGTPKRLSPTAKKIRRFISDKPALISAFFLILLGLLALAADLIAPYGPFSQDLSNSLALPDSQNWLGTDNLGRDVLSRLVFGARVSLFASLIAVGTALAIGVPLGLLAGYVGGWVDSSLMRLTDSLLALPGVILVIAIIAVLGNSLTNSMVALGIVFAPTYIRLVRGEVLAVREEEYVDSARVLGLPHLVIVVRHILPNVLSPVIVQTSVMMGLALILEAGLSYIGLGVQPPNPSWGSMLSEASRFLYGQPFLVFPPGLAITATVLAFNLFGDGVRDAVGRALESGSSRPPPAAEQSLAAVRTAEHQECDDGAPNNHALSGSPDDLALQVRGLRIAFPGDRGGWHSVVDGIDLDIRRGETVGLVGESGSGKSMTAFGVMQLVPAPGAITAGSVKLGDRELMGLRERELRRVRGQDIALISQEPMSSLNPAYTVGNQLVEAIRCHGTDSRSAAKGQAIELLERVGIDDAKQRINAYPHQFSGGMAQRVMIAMALSCKPKVLIADEPTTALDVTVQAEILNLLRDLQEEIGMGILFVTHDLSVVADICDRAVVMYAGQRVESASADDLFERPRHPYTDGLLRSLPQVALAQGGLYRIPGVVPGPGRIPSGCRFADRCEFVQDACTTEPVGETPLSHDLKVVRCVRHDELNLNGVQT